MYPNQGGKMYPNARTSVYISINVNIIIFCLSLLPFVSLYLSLSLSVSLCLSLCLTDLWESTGTSVQMNALPVFLLRQVSSRGRSPRRESGKYCDGGTFPADDGKRSQSERWTLPNDFYFRDCELGVPLADFS